MNHALITVMGGRADAREALEEYTLQPGSEDSFCTLGLKCVPWAKSKAGKVKAAYIFKRMKEYETRN